MLGRPGNNVKVGIVGVPNVGKSSFFNILGKMNVPAENFPFCTIDPNVAIVPVPDARFKWLVKKYKPASEVPPNMTVTDIAGLVKVKDLDVVFFSCLVLFVCLFVCFALSCNVSFFFFFFL